MGTFFGLYPRNLNLIWLVVSTHLKNISPNGDLPQIGMNVQKYLKPPPSYCLTTCLPPRICKNIKPSSCVSWRSHWHRPVAPQRDQCNKHKQTPATHTLPRTNSKSPLKMGNIFASSKRQVSGVNALLLSGRKDASRVGKVVSLGTNVMYSSCRKKTLLETWQEFQWCAQVPGRLVFW